MIPCKRGEGVGRNSRDESPGFIRPSAVSVGAAWAGSGRRPESGRLRLKCLLNCGNARMSGRLHVLLRGLPAGLAWAMRGTSGWFAYR